MVYKLYKLTYDEVLVVDKDFEMGKEEYEKISLECESRQSTSFLIRDKFESEENSN